MCFYTYESYVTVKTYNVPNVHRGRIIAPVILLFYHGRLGLFTGKKRVQKKVNVTKNVKSSKQMVQTTELPYTG